MSVPLPEYLAVPQGVRLKIKEPELPGDNVLMASSDAGYVFGRKMNREQIATIYFQNKKKNIGEDAWDVSEKQNGSIMAWTEEKEDGLLDLYIAANGNIMANRDCSHLFSDYSTVKNIVGLEFLKTDQTENMKEMFKCCESLKSLDLSYFDTSQVKDMNSMFWFCRSLKNLDLSHFDTSQVKDMSCMFIECCSLENLDLSHFDSSQVTNMFHMFTYCSNLKSLDLSHFDTSQVKVMSCMFEGCASLKSLDLSHFATSQVVMGMDYMFRGCENLEDLDVSGFDTSCVRSMKDMFDRCKSLKILDISNFDTSHVENLSVPLPEYLAVPRGVNLKIKKANGFFRKLWEKLSN